jgi:iron complex transport system permease protein
VNLQKICLEYRVFQAVVFLGLGLLLTIALSLSFGAVPMSSAQLWQAFLHRGDAVNQTIFWELRLPRVAAALTVGAALGMSGSLLQGLLRNGLADPFVLGISAGAGLVAITMLTLGIFQTWVPLAAWIGAILTSMLVYFLGKTKTGISVERLVLAGVAVSSLFGAIQTTLQPFASCFELVNR